MGVGLREVVAHGGLTLWLAFLKSVAAIPGIVKVKPFHTVQAYRKQVFTEIENIPVIGYYKFTIDSGKALTIWFAKSLQYSSDLYTKYIAFLYKIPPEGTLNMKGWGCSSEILNYTPKGDRSGRGSSFF